LVGQGFILFGVGLLTFALDNLGVRSSVCKTRVILPRSAKAAKGSTLLDFLRTSNASLVSVRHKKTS
jgi:hypothetical protein